MKFHNYLEVSAAIVARLALGLLSLLSLGGLVLAQSSAQVTPVTIDVKPGDTPTIIEPKRGGMVPVAILSTSEFDATRVDPATVRVGATGTEASVFRSASEDIDKDGDTDLILLVRVPDMKLECSHAAVWLKGKTRDGKDIEGKEAVTMQGCR